MITLLFIIAWLIIGAWGLIHYWMKEYDFKTSEIFLAVMYSFLGPFSWLILWIAEAFENREKKKATTIFKSKYDPFR